MGKKLTDKYIDTNPYIFPEGTYMRKDINALKRKHSVWQTRDIYEEQSREFFKITHPGLPDNSTYKQQSQLFIDRRLQASFSNQGNWVYFPWNGNLIHTVNAEEYFLLRTNRNRNLITTAEQRRLRDACIGVIGLSVGGSLAVGLSYQGIGNNLKLAESDSLETTNLNRLRAGIHHVGLAKITVAAQQIYEINPYISLYLFPAGLNERNLNSFIADSPKPRVIFEIIDDFVMKIKLRLAARIAGIPVISMANLGDSILVDVERFDQNPKLPLFNGIIGKLPETILENPDEDKHKYAVALVGKDNVPQRALSSVAQIGKTLIGRPQLSGTVTVSSGLGSFIARQIILNGHLPSGRYRIAFSDIFDS